MVFIIVYILGLRAAGPAHWGRVRSVSISEQGRVYSHQPTAFPHESRDISDQLHDNSDQSHANSDQSHDNSDQSRDNSVVIPLTYHMIIEANP